MGLAAQRSSEVFRVRPVTLWTAVLVALLLQTSLPVKLAAARLVDFPLLVIIYFALVRRNKVFGMALGTGMGLMQDALSHGFIGIFGMANTLIGYLAASASVRFEIESLLPRSILTGIFVLVHSLSLLILKHGLLGMPPPFRPLNLLSSILANVALGIVVFQLLDRFRHPA
jgi:rod shape-determining protein MreD